MASECKVWDGTRGRPRVSLSGNVIETKVVKDDENRYLKLFFVTLGRSSGLEGLPIFGNSSNLITYFSTITFSCWHDMGNSMMSNWKSSQILE